MEKTATVVVVPKKRVIRSRLTRSCRLISIVRLRGFASSPFPPPFPLHQTFPKLPSRCGYLLSLGRWKTQWRLGRFLDRIRSVFLSIPLVSSSVRRRLRRKTCRSKIACATSALENHFDVFENNDGKASTSESFSVDHHQQHKEQYSVRWRSTYSRKRVKATSRVMWYSDGMNTQLFLREKCFIFPETIVSLI